MTQSHRLTAALMAAAAALLATASGCGGQQPAAPGTPGSPSGGGVVSSGPLTSSPSTPGPATNEVVPAAAVGLVVHRWERAEAVPGTTDLLVHATLSGGPPCAVLGRVDLVERADAVTVTLWVGQQAGADCDGPQPDLGFPISTRVRLAAPLDGRPVLDGGR